MATPSTGKATGLWATHSTTIIAVSVVVALIAAFVGVRVAVGGDADGDGELPTIADATTGDTSTDAGSTGEATTDAGTGSDAGDTTDAEAGSDAGDTTDGGTAVAPGGTASGATDGGGTDAATDGGTDGGTTDGATDGGGGDDTTGGLGATSTTTGTSDSTATTGPAPGTALPGVTADEIRIAYYWRGDRTRSSQYLNSAGQSGNVDEGDAFRKFVEYLNANPKGTWMGFDYDLHGRTIVGQVFEVGNEAETYAEGLADIDEFDPMAGLSPTGSMSDFFCPELAARGVHNFATYDLRGNLPAKTDGYCTPAGLPWERQVELSAAWLARQQANDPYAGSEGAGAPERAYGIVYSQLEGLEQGSAQQMLDAFQAAGVNVVEVVPISPGLTDSQGEIGDAVAKFRAAGVNTVVMPDGGAALSFTHGATSNAYFPDYYVWPCSGQDTVGFVRLLDGRQWENASGLSCYDEAYHSDVTLNDRMTASEWYAAYKEVAPNDNPPVQAPFAYSGMLPILVGITGAGPDLTLENFRAALDGFGSYRYDFIEGRTTDASRITVDLGDPTTRAIVADAITVGWNGSKQIPGAASPGAYDYPEGVRYRRGSEL